MLMPSLHQQLAVFLHKPFNFVKFSCVESVFAFLFQAWRGVPWR